MLSQTQKLSKCKLFLNIYYTNIRDIKLNSYWEPVLDFHPTFEFSNKILMAWFLP